MTRQRKEVGVDLFGLNALEPFVINDSAPRRAMAAAMFGQAPVIEGNEPARIFTGVELEYSQETFNIAFPCDATVLRIIRKYPVGIGRDAIHYNPITAILYEDYYDPYKTVGVIEVPEYLSFHQEFGYPLVRNPEVWERLAPGENFAKGEVIAHSPAVRRNGQYGIGLEAETALMSLPATIEDGFIISESLARRLTPTTYTRVMASWGRRSFPLNLYGDENTYKPFPDIGECIGEHGIIVATRETDEDLAVAEMTPRALRTVDHAFDRPLYGKPGSRVVDIKVYHDERLNPPCTPHGMDEQVRKYYDATATYYRTLLEEWERMRARKARGGGELRVTPELNSLLVDAMIFLPVSDDKRKLTRMWRTERLDEWTVEITYETKLEVGVGYKLTDKHGGKGVACKVMPDDQMPRDANGNIAHLVVYGNARVKRMNMGGLYEQFINAASRDLTHRLRREAGLQPKIPPTAYQLAQLREQPELLQRQFDTLMRYYEIVAPLQYDLLLNDPDPGRHVLRVLKDGVYLYIPPDNPVDNLEMAKALKESEFCPHYGPVTYVDANGQTVTTKDPVLIGSLYILLLEKTGEDWSGVASVKTNHFGVPAKLNNYDKHTSPGRQQTVRALGESESRSYVCTVGPWATMELLDQSNSPDSHKERVETILKAPKPANIERSVDRTKIPLGGSRPVALVNHLLNCRGVRFVYTPETTSEDQL